MFHTRVTAPVSQVTVYAMSHTPVTAPASQVDRPRLTEAHQLLQTRAGGGQGQPQASPKSPWVA